MIQYIKEGIKILGIACSSFDRLKDTSVPVHGVVYRGATLFEGAMKTIITVDGEDATKKIITMIKQSAHYEQLKMIMTRGITIAGFNYIDIKQLNEETGLPVITVVDRKPDLEKIKSAIQNVVNWEHRFKIISNSGTISKLKTSTEEEPVYVQSISIEGEELDALLKKITIVGRIPEPIRVAKLIATAETYK